MMEVKFPLLNGRPLGRPWGNSRPSGITFRMGRGVLS